MAIALAAGLEASSNHPYAQAVIALAEDESIEPLELTEISDIKNGISAKLKGDEVSLVRAEKSMVTGALLKSLENALQHGQALCVDERWKASSTLHLRTR